MSMKRTEAESTNDEQTTEGSDPVSQQRHNAKRAKLVSLSDTTLQDLPIELLECILVKLVAMEVKDMKLAKSVWKEKPDLVIDRLRTVCSQWNSICETKFFRNEIHRTLDVTAQETIRLEILHQYPIQYTVLEYMTAMKDEIFLLCRLNGDGYVINVLDYNNMAEVKDVIPLPGIRPTDIAACSVSNCVYVQVVEVESESDLVLRITKAEEHQYVISPWIPGRKKASIDMSTTCMSVSANRSLITLSREQIPNPTVVSIYAPDGSLQHEVMLSPGVYGFKTVNNVIQKSNGNLVLLSLDDRNKTHLMEIDAFGSVIRRFQSALSADISVNFADIYGRILITNWECRSELLDSEFNLLEFTGLQAHEAQIFIPRKLHFSSERNEIICLYASKPSGIDVLAIFRFM